MRLHFILFCDFFSGFRNRPVQSRKETAQRSYGNRADSVKSPQRRIQVTRISYGARAAAIQMQRGDRIVVVHSLGLRYIHMENKLGNTSCVVRVKFGPKSSYVLYMF